MNAQKLHALADRCRKLVCVAVRDDVREQLRQWVLDVEAEADAADKAEHAQRR